eukprot:COSAG01_NODE_6110_length_3844_cov_375.454206_1_plen_41_part_00
MYVTSHVISHVMRPQVEASNYEFFDITAHAKLYASQMGWA